jgi:hypothetical protein
LSDFADRMAELERARLVNVSYVETI